VFLLIFKMMSMTVWFGLLNGLCLVPTILSLVGPEPPAASKPADIAGPKLANKVMYNLEVHAYFLPNGTMSREVSSF
jgi:hypothetical protein